MSSAYKKRNAPCYPAKNTWDPHDPDTFFQQYDFAEEFDDDESFLSEYHDLPSDEIANVPTVAPRICGLHDAICKKCEASVPNIYTECLLRDMGFENERALSVSIVPRIDKTPSHCTSWGRYISKSRTSTAWLAIRDVRLRGMPTELSISRLRYKCSNKKCNRLVGDDCIAGLQSYTRGEMTLRLTASVFICYIHGVKRKNIAEAYSLSAS